MYLIFDFDGTIVDSFSCVVKKIILLSEEFNFKKINSLEINNLRNLTSKELIKYLEIPFYKIPQIIYKARKCLRNEMQTLLPIENIPQVLNELYNSGSLLGILTSNSKENVLIWLKYNKMEHLFKFIHIESQFFSKKYLLHKILKKYGMNKLETFYIGDEARDVEAANKNDINSVAVTWGYNSEETILRYNPRYLARSPQDILSICRSDKKIWTR